MIATQLKEAETPQTTPAIAVGDDSGAGLKKLCLGVKVAKREFAATQWLKSISRKHFRKKS